MQVKSVRLSAPGEPLQVVQAPLDPPGEGEVTVEMAFGAVNPLDRYAALGRVAPDGPLPRTLGAEGSGMLGGTKVTVFGHGLGLSRQGVWAQAATVPRSAVVEVPEPLSLEVAAAVGVAGVTAWRCLFEKAQVSPDDRVLVLGASGGVGSLAVSLAAMAGAEVWAQTTSQDKAEWVKNRGAGRVLVGTAEQLLQEGVRAALAPTVVLDCLGGGFFAAAVELLEPRGRLVIYGTSADTHGQVPLQAVYRKGLTVMGYGGLIEPPEALAQAARELMGAMAAGRVDIPVDRVLPMERAQEALDALAERSVRGKLLLDLAG